MATTAAWPADTFPGPRAYELACRYDLATTRLAGWHGKRFDAPAAGANEAHGANLVRDGRWCRHRAAARNRSAERPPAVEGGACGYTTGFPNRGGGRWSSNQTCVAVSCTPHRFAMSLTR
jgi:hypothetical protein